MEGMIGRLLLRDEVVHHRDKNKQNNAPENLELFCENGLHLHHELAGRCPQWTEDGKKRIQKAASKRRGPLSEETKEKMRQSHRRRAVAERVANQEELKSGVDQ